MLTPADHEDLTRRLDLLLFDPLSIRKHAEGFDRLIFKEKFRQYIESILHSNESKNYINAFLDKFLFTVLNGLINKHAY
ncbi:MAG: hypothetical protein NUV74_17710 [Candidatus Brocadiaceae bacterium]|nr:hypothetical protein [Candidatus Brocadiaceae bacterium]